jgi:uncharacterized protein (DUF488 family)
LTLYTIGYGGRGKESFLGLLLAAGVEVVADVRIAPERASMGMFVKAKSPEKGIEHLLAGAGIDYQWLGELGNPARGEPGMATFRSHMAERPGPLTSRLQELARARRVCLLCAEKDPGRCHRAVIADYLATLGWEVVHLV